MYGYFTLSSPNKLPSAKFLVCFIFMPPNKIWGIIKSNCPSVYPSVRPSVRPLSVRSNFVRIWGHLSHTVIQFLFKVLQCRSKLVEMSECQTAWIWVRRQVTRHLTRIQAVCIWHYSRAWRSKG